MLMVLPRSAGVKCALPDRPVVLFSGDGGFYYHIGELETAARHGINLDLLSSGFGKRTDKAVCN